MYVHMSVDINTGQKRALNSPGAEMIGGCEVPNVGAGY